MNCLPFLMSKKWETVHYRGVGRLPIRVESHRAYASARETARFTPSKMSTMLTPSTM